MLAPRHLEQKGIRHTPILMHLSGIPWHPNLTSPRLAEPDIPGQLIASQPPTNNRTSDR